MFHSCRLPSTRGTKQDGAHFGRSLRPEDRNKVRVMPFLLKEINFLRIRDKSTYRRAKIANRVLSVFNAGRRVRLVKKEQEVR